MKEPEKDELFIAGIERAMRVLRTVADSGTPMGVSEIARAAGLNQATTWRICHTFQKLGYLSSTASGQLSPGLPLLGLGHAALASERLVDIAAPVLKKLAEQFNAVVAVAVPDGDSMLYVSRAESSLAMLTMNLKVGSRVPILTSALGWAYLASLQGADRSHRLAGLRKRHAAAYANVQATLEQQLQAFESRGFVVNEEVFHPNVGFVGVPLTHPRSGDVYVFNCGGVLTSITHSHLANDLGPALCEVVGQLRHALGT